MFRIGMLAVASLTLAAVLPATAADVTQQRLVDAPTDAQNWLMVHRDYDNSAIRRSMRSIAAMSQTSS